MWQGAHSSEIDQHRRLMFPYDKRACPGLTYREMTSVPFSPRFISVKITIAGVIVWIYVHSCHIKAAPTKGNVGALLKIFSWWLCGKARPPLGSLLSTLLIILPFHPMPWLNPWATPGPLSRTRLLRLYPPPCPANKLLQRASVHAHIIFFVLLLFPGNSLE